jgi:hypothetical protein
VNCAGYDADDDALHSAADCEFPEFSTAFFNIALGELGQLAHIG